MTAKKSPSTKAVKTGKSARKSPHPRAPQRVYQLHVQLDDIEPAVWRRLWAPDNLTLGQLDQLVQAAMGWENAHMHAFDIGGQRYSAAVPKGLVVDEDDDSRDERQFDLATVLAEEVREFRYTYDFGDDWRHRIRVEALLAPDAKNQRPLCIAGANACPPEDTGGFPGYELFVQAISDPAHPEHLSLWQWYGGPFDPQGFDANMVNATLREMGL